MADLYHTNLQEATEALSLYIGTNIESLASLEEQAEALRNMLPTAAPGLAQGINEKLARLDSLKAIIENHGELVQRLSAIDELIKQYNTPDKNGILPDLDADRNNALQEAYKNAYEAARQFRTSIREAKQIADPGTGECLEGLMGLSRTLAETMAHDMQILQHYKPETTKAPLMYIMELSREHTVDLGDKKIEAVGDFMSERLPFAFRDAYGNLHEGFFTPEKHVSMDVGFDALIAKEKSANNPVASVLDNIEAYMRAHYQATVEYTEDLPPEAARQSALYMFLRVCDSKNGFSTQVMAEKLTEVCQEYTPELLQGEAAQKNRKAINSLASRMISSFNEPYRDILHKGHMLDRRMHGTRLDSRNAAMSVMADLLGKPELVARSTPMNIRRNGQLIKGTFMEKAKGVDPSHASFLERNYSTAMLNTGSGLRSLADLQVLDFLCANTDRHVANMFYRFDKESLDPREHKFIGVQGIDNDNSFGLLYCSDRTQSNGYLASWNDMRVMSQSMANTVNALTPKTLGFMLQGLNLTPKEIEATMHRLRSMQEFMKEDAAYFEQVRTDCEALEQKQTTQALTPEEQKKLESDRKILNHEVLPPNRVSIIPDDKFNTLSLKKLLPPRAKGQETKASIFQSAAQFSNALDRGSDEKIRVVKLPQNSRISAHAVQVDVDGARAMYQLLENHTKKGKAVSPQYSALQNAVEDFWKFSVENSTTPMTRESLAERNAHLRNLVNLANEYLEFKKTDGLHSSYARSRIKLVKDLKTDFEEAIFTPTPEEEKLMDYYKPMHQQMQKKINANKVKAAQESLKPINGPEAQNTRPRSNSISKKSSAPVTRKRGGSLSMK